MTTRYYRYECVLDGQFYRGTPRRAGDIIETRNSVAPDGFVATNRDIHTPFSGMYRGLNGTVYFGEGVYAWDDLSFPLTRDRQGVANKPDYDFTNFGLLFPQDDPTEIAYLSDHLPHEMRAGSPFHAHVHILQTGEEEPVYKMDYRVFANEATPGSFTTLTADTFSYEYVSGSIVQRAVFPVIPGDVSLGLSPFLEVRLYRDDNVVVGDVLTKKFDVHFQKDSFGSGRETQK